MLAAFSHFRLTARNVLLSDIPDTIKKSKSLLSLNDNRAVVYIIFTCQFSFENKKKKNPQILQKLQILMNFFLFLKSQVTALILDQCSELAVEKIYRKISNFVIVSRLPKILNFFFVNFPSNSKEFLRNTFTRYTGYNEKIRIVTSFQRWSRGRGSIDLIDQWIKMENTWIVRFRWNI